MKIRSLLFSVGVVVVASLSCAAEATQQSKERLIRRMPLEQNEPISITDIKVNDRSVSFDKKFNADDEWLRTLVITIRNTSDHRILFVSVQLQFPRQSGSQERFSIFNMSNGNAALQTRLPKPDERSGGIGPGEMVELQLSAQEFVGLNRLLIGTQYSSSIERVDVRIDRAIFEDDTMWSRGADLRRDPLDPRTWINSVSKASR